MTIQDQTALSSGAGAVSPLPQPFADPALITLHDRWWLFPTTDGVPEWGADSFRALSSPDLVDWTDHGVILTLGVDVAWATERAWAPAMVERDGRFYFYFTADKNIGVAVGERPEGPFRDLGRPLIAAGDYPGLMIDPSVYIDGDGTAYLYWGNGTAYGVPLHDDMVSFDSASVRAWQPTGFREAAWVHRHGETYYLTWSENDTRSEDYRVRYASGPSPLGPWTDGHVILEKAPESGFLGTGHHSVARVPHTDDWVIAFHRFRVPGGHGYNREVMFAPLIHQENGRIEPVVLSDRLLRKPLARLP